jgi:hypothetical protein
MDQPIGERGGRIGAGTEGSEQAVEHDQHAAKVAVEIGAFAAVVGAMMARGVEHAFERPEADRRLGVQDELVEQVGPQQHRDHDGRKTQQRKRQEAQPAQ